MDHQQILLILFAQDNRMKGNTSFQGSREVFKQKEKASSDAPKIQSHFAALIAKRSTMQGFTLQPPSFQKTTSAKIQNVAQPSKANSLDNPQKIKSCSFYEKVGKQQAELGVQGEPRRHQREERDGLQQIKYKLERYYQQLQRKDQIIVRKEKELIEMNRQLEQANEAISNLTQSSQQLADKCNQLEHAIRQKEQFFDTRIQELQALQSLKEENRRLCRIVERAHLQPAEAFRQFEAKINSCLEENGRLKNLIGHLEGEVEQLCRQKDSLEATLKAYEERDRLQKASLLEGEVRALQQTLQRERMQRDELLSRQEMQILKLENQIDSSKVDGGTLISLQDQERLRQRLFQALKQIERMGQGR